MPKPCPTGQKPFSSKSAAKACNATNPKRIRVFRCAECRLIHITSQKIHKETPDV